MFCKKKLSLTTLVGHIYNITKLKGLGHDYKPGRVRLVPTFFFRFLSFSWVTAFTKVAFLAHCGIPRKLIELLLA